MNVEAKKSAEEVPDMVARDLTILEAVALAIRSEMDSNDLYGQLAERVRNPEVKALLSELAEDEDKHRQGLLNLYTQLLEGQEPAIPRKDGRHKKVDLGGDPDYLEVVRAARDKERDSESTYREAAERVRDYNTQQFFLELAETERRHAHALETQVAKLEKDPNWFDENEDGALVHIGP